MSVLPKIQLAGGALGGRTCDSAVLASNITWKLIGIIHREEITFKKMEKVMNKFNWMKKSDGCKKACGNHPRATLITHPLPSNLLPSFSLLCHGSLWAKSKVFA